MAASVRRGLMETIVGGDVLGHGWCIPANGGVLWAAVRALPGPGWWMPAQTASIVMGVLCPVAGAGSLSSRLVFRASCLVFLRSLSQQVEGVDGGLQEPHVTPDSNAVRASDHPLAECFLEFFLAGCWNWAEHVFPKVFGHFHDETVLVHGGIFTVHCSLLFVAYGAAPRPSFRPAGCS